MFFSLDDLCGFPGSFSGFPLGLAFQLSPLDLAVPSDVAVCAAVVLIFLFGIAGTDESIRGDQSLPTTHELNHKLSIFPMPFLDNCLLRVSIILQNKGTPNEVICVKGCVFFIPYFFSIRSGNDIGYLFPCPAIPSLRKKDFKRLFLVHGVISYMYD